jgi:hypothetical protein
MHFNPTFKYWALHNFENGKALWFCIPNFSFKNGSSPLAKNIPSFHRHTFNSQTLFFVEREKEREKSL